MKQAQTTIYVVDDEPPVRRAISRLLASEGYQVQQCDSAEDLLARLKPDRVGCVVLDISMPGMDGMALQSALCESASAAPIVFLTGHGDIPMSVRAMKRGAVDFLTKPVDDTELLDAVGRATEHARSERTAQRCAAQLAEREATLTPRERQVMGRVVLGMLNKQIAAELGTVEKTIKVHRSRVMEKMGAGSLPDLVRMAETLHPSPQPVSLAP